jgi:hypothetical protein
MRDADLATAMSSTQFPRPDRVDSTLVRRLAEEALGNIRFIKILHLAGVPILHRAVRQL